VGKGARERRLAVRFDDAVWREAIRGFSGRSLEVATSARARVEQQGVALSELRPCEAAGPRGTRLAGCVKLYLPLAEAPASERPFAFILQLARGAEAELVWIFVAFGHRHPGKGVRTVYERAHRQLHGRFP
jgi:hypothetical protein